MKYDITHTCGCIETVDIFGTNVHGERDKQAAHLEAKPCNDCARREKMDAANATGMAELQGSEKQIAWAIDIRAKMVDDLHEFHANQLKLAEGTVTEEQVALAKSKMDAILVDVQSNTSAKWFIENRTKSAWSLSADIMNKLEI